MKDPGFVVVRLLYRIESVSSSPINVFFFYSEVLHIQLNYAMCIFSFFFSLTVSTSLMKVDLGRDPYSIIREIPL